ncbi:hypothetical protein [Photobacterium leiognathi]|uniref:hypothetical protein n=1 Tax=Photobacterium leiognathi TaxID=553611 RepID=UPI002981350B|nr:hypothetical protein [Photobacterium leiognathi]
MIKFLLVLITCLQPLAAFAASGVFVMSGVLYEKYQLVDNKPVLQYKIKAEKQKEVINLSNSSSMMAIIYDEIAAKKRFSYSNGTLMLSNREYINFHYAYYYNGKFVMNRANGYIGNRSFFSSKIVLDEQARSLHTKRIIIEDITGKHSLINYSLSLE